jgi:hypothetical protein
MDFSQTSNYQGHSQQQLEQTIWDDRVSHIHPSHLDGNWTIDVGGQGRHQ